MQLTWGIPSGSVLSTSSYAWTDWQVTAPDRTDDLSIRKTAILYF